MKTYEKRTVIAAARHFADYDTDAIQEQVGEAKFEYHDVRKLLPEEAREERDFAPPGAFEVVVHFTPDAEACRRRMEVLAARRRRCAEVIAQIESLPERFRPAHEKDLARERLKLEDAGRVIARLERILEEASP